MTTHDRLSALDASFLHLESPETPMHVGALGIFDGGPLFDPSGRFRLAAVRSLIASRLHLVPRFRKRLMTVPMEQGRPIWVDDTRFDISYHVRLTALPKPGSREQLLALTGRIQSQMLDRSRPLWELWFVEGLEAGRVALVQKTHHAMVDGVSGVDVATVLLDLTPDPEILDAPGWIPQPAPTPARLLADTLVERSSEPSEMVRSVRGLARTPQRVAEQTTKVARAVRAALGDSPLAPRTSFNVAVGRSRRFVGVRISLDDVATIRQEWGGTVNDVVLAIVAGALRRRLAGRGDPLPETLRALCPVSVRADAERLQLGNRISAMFVDLPIAEPSPVARLDAIRTATRDLKDSEQAAGTAVLLDLSQYADPRLLGLAARAVQHQPFVNLVITNVPGPPVPLYCLGAELLEAYPMVPLSRNLTLGVAVLSYCGALHVGLLAGSDAWPDLDDFATDLEAACADLRQAAPVFDVDEGAVG
ncbi:MAG: WS/DGAT/MGAT family O-acyltransferase [Acidimicrobiia bacterium]